MSRVFVLALAMVAAGCGTEPLRSQTEPRPPAPPPPVLVDCHPAVAVGPARRVARGALGRSYVRHANEGRAHDTSELVLVRRGRPARILAEAGQGEEGGADIVGPAILGRALVWAVVEGEPARGFRSRIVRLDLATGHRTHARFAGALLSVSTRAPLRVDIDRQVPEGFDPAASRAERCSVDGARLR